MSITNKALTKQLNKSSFVPSEPQTFKVGASKKILTHVIDDYGQPTDECYEQTIFTSIREPQLPQIDQNLSADDLRISCLQECGLLKDFTLPSYFVTSSPEAMQVVAQSLFNTAVDVIKNDFEAHKKKHEKLNKNSEKTSETTTVIE